VAGDQLLQGDSSEAFLRLGHGASLSKPHGDGHGRPFDCKQAVDAERGTVGVNDDLAVVVVAGADALANRRRALLEGRGRIGGDDHRWPSISVHHRDRTSQDVVQGRGDLWRTASGERDPREAVVDVEHVVQALPLRFEKGVEDSRSHVGEGSVLRERDHR
jgi:hypothetical protein